MQSFVRFFVAYNVFIHAALHDDINLMYLTRRQTFSISIRVLVLCYPTTQHNVHIGPQFLEWQTFLRQHTGQVRNIYASGYAT